MDLGKRSSPKPAVFFFGLIVAIAGGFFMLLVPGWNAPDGQPSSLTREFRRLYYRVKGVPEQNSNGLKQLSLVVFPYGKEAAANSDCPMFGGTPRRNMVNTVDKGLPTEWSVEKGKQQNVKWEAQLGSKAYGGPVIAGGKVFVGTNNAFPRDPKVKGTRAVVMCFTEADGKFLWQTVHEIPTADAFKDARPQGLCSTPVVEGNRLYYVTPSCELTAADTETGKVVWQLDMMKELKVVPYHLGNCSPVVVGELVFAVTGNGTDDDGKVVSPKAPSFVAVHKKTGKLAWQSNLPADKIIEGQWSNPCVAVVQGKEQIIFPGGDCWLYSFEPQTGKLIWKFNCNPGRAEGKEEKKIANYMVSTPVVHENRVYIGLGLYPEHPTPGVRFSHFLCVDTTRRGDVSPARLDGGKDGNPNSALAWAYGGPIVPPPKGGRPVVFGRTMSTAAVHDGLAYISEEAGYLHCLDAKTGKKCWDHDFLAPVWGSPYWVDGKVYIGTEDGEVFIFAHGREKKLIRQISMEEAIHSTPVAANGLLYVMTRAKLYALGKK